jgi:hypothetical protein
MLCFVQYFNEIQLLNRPYEQDKIYSFVCYRNIRIIEHFSDIFEKSNDCFDSSYSNFYRECIK